MAITSVTASHHNRTLSDLWNTLPTLYGVSAFAIFLATRLALTVFTGFDNVPVSSWPYIFLRGLWFDLATLGFILVPFLFAAALIPEKWRHSRFHTYFGRFIAWLLIAALLFTAIGEFFFWLEFSNRFNFIALDYLIYTQEVIGNIEQSYPVKTLVAAIGLLAAGAVWLMRGWFRQIEIGEYSRKTRIILAALMVLWPASAYTFANLDQMYVSANNYANELSGNGLFSLVAAFRRNELDYDRFYATIPDGQAKTILRDLGVKKSGPASEAAVANDASGPMPDFLLKRPKNIVMITVESLSGEFVGALGDKRGWTPNLDRIAGQGLLFDRMFATGTRTVRGLEATTLGTPPVPGQAIVRRPNNQHLTTVGGILAHDGYASTFAYGGYSYFDNMAAYYSGNDYAVFDRTEFPADTIPAANVWGVADEALFSNVDAMLSKPEAAGKPFFVQIMTTTNHRPYTYPDGRIDVPSPGGHEGGVKYTDYAIGRFIDEASKKPWFKDTMFVIIADHCASVAGKVELPVESYHIPMIFYGPEIVKPGHFSENISQLDVPPTLLDVLGKPGESYFYGRSARELKADPQGVFISNYQSLGYYKNNRLTVLKPGKVVESFTVDPITFETTPGPVDAALAKEAIAYYQTASHAFKTGELTAPWYAKTN